jgi:hypothetical protein
LVGVLLKKTRARPLLSAFVRRRRRTAGLESA